MTSGNVDRDLGPHNARILAPTKMKISGHALAVVSTFCIWAAVVIGLAVWGVFDVPGGEPALPTLLAIGLPVIGFVTAIAALPGVRAWVLELDPVLLTEFQAWRILGGLFLAVYAFGHLPGFFAWPAGLGDIAVGVAAPFIAWRLRTDPTFLTSLRNRSFHFAGLLDFVIAVSTGIAAREQVPGLVDGVTSSAMEQLPLVLIPTLVVPAFIILHLIVLFQIAQQKR